MMKEETIVQVAKVLETWNPLGEAANSVEQLDGYRTEAIDIISTTNIIFGRENVERAVEGVLTQAFEIELNSSELAQAAKEIGNLLDLE